MAIVPAVLLLSACGGGEASSASGNGSGSGPTEYVRVEDSSNTVMTMTVDGMEVTHTLTKCGETDDEATSIGELDEDGGVINWTTSAEDFSSRNGTFDMQNDVTVTDQTLVIPYTFRPRADVDPKDDELVYRLADSDEGQEIISESEERCS